MENDYALPYKTFKDIDVQTWEVDDNGTLAFIEVPYTNNAKDFYLINGMEQIVKKNKITDCFYTYENVNKKRFIVFYFKRRKDAFLVKMMMQSIETA